MYAASSRCLLCIWTLLAAATVLCDATEREFLVPIEYKFGSGGAWRRRGSLLLFTSRLDAALVGRAVPALTLADITGVEYNAPVELWTLDDLEAADLHKAVEDNELYYVRCPTELEKRVNALTPESTVFSSNLARRLVASELREVISLSVDTSQRRVLSVTSLPDVPRGVVPHDGGERTWRHHLEPAAYWNVTVRLANTVEASGPDTASYLQKLDMERQARERGDTADNRSFLAKYWMYIVPVVVIMMLTSAAAPEEGAAAQ